MLLEILITRGGVTELPQIVNINPKLSDHSIKAATLLVVKISLCFALLQQSCFGGLVVIIYNLSLNFLHFLFVELYQSFGFRCSKRFIIQYKVLHQLLLLFDYSFALRELFSESIHKLSQVTFA